MRPLLIDVTRLLGRRLKRKVPTGIDRVCQAYVRRYGAHSRAILQRGNFGAILPIGASRRLFDYVLDGGSSTSPEVVRSAPSRSVDSPRMAGSIVLNIGHSGLERPQYADWLARKGLRPIYMVHDLIPLTHPEYCRPREGARHLQRMHTVLDSAAGILTNSQETLRELQAFAEGSNRPMPPALVAPLAPASLPAAGSRPMADPYYVVLSTIEPRKNHLLLLQVWKRLVEILGASAPKLVLIGQRGWECENAVDLLERCPSLAPFIIEKAGCSDGELSTYLTHAQALLFPSFVEGYGLPLVEALSLGVPVLCSDLAVFREIAGSVPEYLDPLDGLQWINRIRAYCDGSGATARSQQISRMSQFAVPTWPEHFARVETLLERVC